MAILDLTTNKGTTIIKIPDFDGAGDVEVEVRRPALSAMLREEDVPNDLLKLAVETATGLQEQSKKPDEMSHEEKLELYQNNMERAHFLVAHVLVNPRWVDFAPVITDDQLFAIYSWAILSPQQMRSFRDEQKVPADHQDGESVSKNAE